MITIPFYMVLTMENRSEELAAVFVSVPRLILIYSTGRVQGYISFRVAKVSSCSRLEG